MAGMEAPWEGMNTNSRWHPLDGPGFIATCDKDVAGK